MGTRYIGLATTVHDPAVAIVDADGEILFAEATERWLQYKRAWHVVPDEPMRIGRLVERYVPPGSRVVIAQSWLRRGWKSAAFRAAFPLVRARVGPRLAPIALGQMNSYDLASLHLERHLEERGCSVERRYYDHHMTHAAMACLASGWDGAAVAVIDANGEKTSEAFFRFVGGEIEEISPTRRKSFGRNGSLGVFYAALCVACGFDPTRGEEWKVMGLASYGRRDEGLYHRMRALLRVEGLGLAGDNHRILRELSALRRDGDPMEAADLAHTGQVVFAELMTELLENLYRASPHERLVLAGGCALNSSFNGRLLDRTPFGELFVPPAPADDGNALGAAWLARREDHPGWTPGVRLSPYLGSTLDAGAVDRLVRHGGLAPAVSRGDVMERAAEVIAEGGIVAVARGRAEFGPRALGHRSILADPRDPEIKAKLNERVKRREPFRPFAPAVLHEHGPAWFEGYARSQYMERALRFRPEACERVPGVVHVDGTGRLQSVERDDDPGFHALISRFFDLTGVPMVLNTSFNVMGKPIVHSVEDAVAVFFTSGIDSMVLEDRFFEKARGSG